VKLIVLQLLESKRQQYLLFCNGIVEGWDDVLFKGASETCASASVYVMLHVSPLLPTVELLQFR
jgi:hypothetical protein